MAHVILKILTGVVLLSAYDASTTEEMKYFMITELIRKRIMQAFPEVEESYADELTENFYNELFS